MTLEGLRYVRNQLGKSADPAGFIHLACGAGAWTWAVPYVSTR